MYVCSKCGKKYNESGSLYNLGVSHYYGRSRESTRYDNDKVKALRGGLARWDELGYPVSRASSTGVSIDTWR